MKWKVKDVESITIWHQWFAWYPVTVNENRVWLECIYRRYVLQRPLGNQIVWSWEYAQDDFDLIKKNQALAPTNRTTRKIF